MRTTHDSWCPADCRYHLNSRGRAEFTVRLHRVIEGQGIGRTVRIMADSAEDAGRKAIARLGHDYTIEGVTLV